MSEKSRVIEYSDLRKKISQMDVYSFSESPTLARNVPEAAQQHNRETPEEDPEIKRNSLSLSVEELLQNYDSSESEKETRKNHQRSYRMSKNKIKSNVSFMRILPWIIIGILSIAVIVFVVLVLTMGVLK